MKTFEDYLSDIYFDKESPSEDNYQEGFENWISEMDRMDIIEYAQKWNDLLLLIKK